MAFHTHHIESQSNRSARKSIALGARDGFTLAESLIASVVLAISVVGIAAAMTCSSQQAMATNDAAITTALGKQLLEEIAARPFPIPGITTNLGWSGGNHDRSTYDDAGDYNGYADSTPITALSGAVINPGAAYTRTVSFVQRMNPSDTPGDGDFALITVTVTGPSGASTIFSKIISNVTLAR
jgi:Tfp pilus assembly protein PilV